MPAATANSGTATVRINCPSRQRPCSICDARQAAFGACWPIFRMFGFWMLPQCYIDATAPCVPWRGMLRWLPTEPGADRMLGTEHIMLGRFDRQERIARVHRLVSIAMSFSDPHYVTDLLLRGLAASSVRISSCSRHCRHRSRSQSKPS